MTASHSRLALENRPFAVLVLILANDLQDQCCSVSVSVGIGIEGVCVEEILEVLEGWSIRDGLIIS